MPGRFFILGSENGVTALGYSSSSGILNGRLGHFLVDQRKFGHFY